MNYNLFELEERYEIKLDSTQKDVLSNLIDFVESEDQTICLKAPAGCGKSLILSMLYDILIDNDISCAFVAPTNKAKLVLTNKGDESRCSLTIHSLLNLRPNIEIMDFDAAQLSFEFNVKKSAVKWYDVLLIDECSMINDDLYNVLCSKFWNRKIVFCGDKSQLAPVKQRNKSKSFDTKVLSLTKIYRQPESKLYKVLEYLRHKPLYHFQNVSDDNGNIIVCNNILEMIDQYSYLFKVSEDFRDHNLVKMITYTNNRINALNQVIRKKLYPEEAEYHLREILTGYDTCNYYDILIENSKDYVVTYVNPTTFTYNNIELLAYDLLLDDGNCKSQVKILSKNNPQWLLDALAIYLEDMRQKAVQSKKSSDWRIFFKLYNSFLTPVDLIYDGRVIKRKSLDYGYCISAHKSQSSSYSIVMIDMENIWRCTNDEELRQLQYVACSRTTSDLIIYQKDGNI